MATINDSRIVYDLVKNDGRYHDDPPLFSVHMYRNAFNGDFCYGLAYSARDHVQYAYPTDFIRDPILLWSQEHGITPRGRTWIADHEELEGIKSTLEEKPDQSMRVTVHFVATLDIEAKDLDHAQDIVDVKFEDALEHTGLAFKYHNLTVLPSRTKRDARIEREGE